MSYYSWEIIKSTPNSVSQSVQLLSLVRLFATPWTAARQASLSITNCQSLPKPMSIEPVMPSNHLILCHPLLLPSIFPSIRVFSNELALCIRWPMYWSFSVSPSMNIQAWFPLALTGLISLQPKWLSRVLSSTTVWKHQFFDAQTSLLGKFISRLANSLTLLALSRVQKPKEPWERNPL